MGAYYNENDPFCVAWLRELIRRGLIADGDVDDRSISDVQSEDLRGYTQHHFFAGIGGWTLALRLAGVSDLSAVWTGSCPCQPFSAAGQGKGFADARHLWPQWWRLIREYRPQCIFGEQVDKALAWLDLVSGDLEGEGYAVGSAIVGAHSVGAPHIRQRIYWVADRAESRRPQAWEYDGGSPLFPARSAECGGDGIGMGESAEGRRRPRRSGEAVSGQEPCGEIERSGIDIDMDHSPLNGRQQWRSSPSERSTVSASELGHHHHPRPQGRGVSDADRERERGGELAAGETGVDGELAISNGGNSSAEGLQRSRQQRLLAPDYWADCDWLPCIDGKSRPVESGTFPLANGIPSRVGRLRGYGNAIVPQVAAQFISAYLECRA